MYVYCGYYPWLVTAAGDCLYWGEGEFTPYIIAYKLLTIILSFYICHACVKQNDDVIVYRGDDTRAFRRDQKRLSECANLGSTDNTMTTRKGKGQTNSGLWNTTHNIKEWAERTPHSKPGWIWICGKIVLKHNNEQIRCYRRYTFLFHIILEMVALRIGHESMTIFLQFRCGCSFCFILLLYLSLICNGLWHYCTARSKWYYFFNRAYAEPCNIIISSVYCRVINKKSSEIS